MELRGEYEEADVGQEKYFAFKSEGALSMVDEIKGTKDVENGQVYVLMSTCGKCNTKSLRSFTKHAYHHGVVLIRCQGCDHVHLVADNLGWFDDKPKNIENMGEVKKVHDPIAIVKFLKAALQPKQK